MNYFNKKATEGELDLKKSREINSNTYLNPQT